MKRFDVDFKDKNKISFISEIKNGLLSEGAVMIRNSISSSKIDFYKNAVDEVTEKLTSQIHNAGIDIEDCDRKYSPEEQKKDEQKLWRDIGYRIGEGHISLQMFQRIFPQFSYHDLISDISFFQICNSIC